MHSSLAPHVHPKCVDIIKAFEKCHEDHKFGKFLGKCNKLKFQLSKCFAEESAERRKKNREEGKTKRKNFEQRYRDYLTQSE